MPRPNALLRLVGFAVAAGLFIAGVQPLVAAYSGSVAMRWALPLTAPAVFAATIVFAVARLSDRGDAVQPPWYSAWLLLPGSFLLAGAAAMCIFGALIQLPLIPWALWVLLAGGAALWVGGLAVVRTRSR